MLIVKYFFVGGISALVDIALFTIFAKILNYNYIVVGTLTFIIATRVNYFLSINFVFKSGIKYKKNKELILVFLVSLVGISINMGVLYFFIEFLQFEMILSKLVASSSVFFWNYLMRRTFIFITYL